MKLLDLFCGAGGAAMGYYRAGFDDITGVDINPMPRYPFKFIQADALEYLAEHGHEYDVIHASPPCQHYSWSAARWGRENYPDLISATRGQLENYINYGRVYVIENVIGAPLHTTIELCGTMFGLKVFRHRRFESSVLLFQPHHYPHNGRVGFNEDDFITVAGHGGDGSARFERWQKAMGIDWMTKEEMAEAIPPAYTEWIGKQLMKIINTHQ